jgi:ribonucleotide reductase alpha subunit
MPTASTSQILGVYESTEPATNNVFSRTTKVGSFTVLNSYLARDLIKANLFTDEIKSAIIQNHGSVQNIAEIPADLRALYKTVWDIKLSDLAHMTADRSAYIDQSSSNNVYLASPSIDQLFSLHVCSLMVNLMYNRC